MLEGPDGEHIPQVKPVTHTLHHVCQWHPEGSEMTSSQEGVSKSRTELAAVQSLDANTQMPEVELRDMSIQVPEVELRDMSIQVPEVELQDMSTQMPDVMVDDATTQVPEVKYHGNQTVPTSS
ncbi:KH domain-containing protein 3-like [Heterocephalus glaber]|uniref:KH domain-containing protein 3-like n=1 Tax=Heterocephalus glaber TaxID=10181 RepID=A0AAX6SZQ4_HETGA|nr:KH domain-containing protein 3-like [Heterocephalus glaber]